MATWYVHPSGENGNNVPGTQANPLRTLQYATDKASPGDIIMGMAGVHTSGFKVTKNNLTYRGMGWTTEVIGGMTFRRPGGAIIDGGGDGDLINCDAGDLIANTKIEGWEIRNSSGALITLPRTRYTEIRDCYLHNSVRPGIIVREADLLLIERNHLFDVAKQNSNAAGNAISILRATDRPGATPASWNGYRSIARWNYIHDIVQNTDTPVTDGGGLAWDGAADNQVDYTGPWLFEGNLIYDCAGSGIRIIWAKDGWVVQNTCVSNCDHPDRTSDFGAGIQMFRSRECHFIANICDEDRTNPKTCGFQDTGAANVFGATGPSEHRGNFYKGPTAATAVDTSKQFNGAPGTMPSAANNYLNVNVQFVRRGGNSPDANNPRNLALQAGSPARGKGLWPGYTDAGAVQSSGASPFEIVSAPVVTLLEGPIVGDDVSYTVGTYSGGTGTLTQTWKWQLFVNSEWVDGPAVSGGTSVIPSVGPGQTTIRLMELATKGSTGPIENPSASFNVSPSGASGADSSFNGHTPNGGGAGGRYHGTNAYVGQAGGSGGGGYGHNSGTDHSAGAASPSGQGYAGGTGAGAAGGGGGGGGGAGGAGSNAANSSGGAGGPGKTFASVLPSEFEDVAEQLGLTGQFAYFSPGGGGGTSAAGGTGGGGQGGGSGSGVIALMTPTTYGGGGGGAGSFCGGFAWP